MQKSFGRFARFAYILIIGVIFSMLFLAAQAQQSTRPIPRPPSPSGRMDYADLPKPHVSIAAVGDVMLGSWVIDLMAREGVDYPFDSTRAFLQSFDFAFANLEAPFSLTGELRVEKKYSFKVPPRYAQGLVRSGIDVVTLANNHIMDFGIEALQNTIATLTEAGIAHCGAGINISEAARPAILEKRGQRVAFLGFSLTFPQEFWATNQSAGTAYPTPSLLSSTIRRVKAKVDYLIVAFHWGQELVNLPKDYQIQFAHSAIDLGADLVLGHHPHVLQGVELYRNKLIAYSLGNYVFGSFSDNAHESIILQVHISTGGLVYAKMIPIHVYNNVVRFQPRALRAAARDSVLARMNRFSLALNQNRSIINRDGQIFPHPSGSIIAKKTQK